MKPKRLTPEDIKALKTISVISIQPHQNHERMLIEIQGGLRDALKHIAALEAELAAASRQIETSRELYAALENTIYDKLEVLLSCKPHRQHPHAVIGSVEGLILDLRDKVAAKDEEIARLLDRLLEIEHAKAVVPNTTGSA